MIHIHWYRFCHWSKSLNAAHFVCRCKSEKTVLNWKLKDEVWFNFWRHM